VIERNPVVPLNRNPPERMRVKSSVKTAKAMPSWMSSVLEVVIRGRGGAVVAYEYRGE
jgi:hypothetical protein